MATISTELATAQVAALANGANLNQNGKVHTGKVQATVSRVTIPAGHAADPVKFAYLPSGTRILPGSFAANATTGGAKTGTVRRDASDGDVVLLASGVPQAEANLNLETGTWLYFIPGASLADGDTLEISLQYIGTH